MDSVAAIHRCLELAREGQGVVGNGAMVGAVLLRDNHIIAEGWHRGWGLAHAERDLPEHFEGTIHPSDILCINLEPCCHHGKTPPCTDFIIERGVRTVIYGMRDPDRRVAGKGIDALRKAGITVIGPVEQALCERLNRGFISVRSKDRPWITLKRALTRDGRTANTDRSTLKITSKDQDQWSHTHLRGTHDAILVGVGTVINDNPILDTRFDAFHRMYQPWRIVLDPSLRTPLSARVVSDEQRERTIVICLESAASKETATILRDRGVNVWGCAMENERFVWEDLWNLCTTPVDGYNGLKSVLVEGGDKTWSTFKFSLMIDEEVVLIGQN